MTVVPATQEAGLLSQGQSGKNELQTLSEKQTKSKMGNVVQWYGQFA
jgi:hypothetical protein